MQYAGFWKRFLACMLDVLPITLLVFCVGYYFFGFDQTLSSFLSGDGSIEQKGNFLNERNKIRDSSLLIFLIYEVFMDCSRFQGTHGKIFLNLKVVDESGEKITFKQSVIRVLMKVVGAIPLYLGYLWSVFREDKAAWHDVVAKTRVIKS